MSLADDLSDEYSDDENAYRNSRTALGGPTGVLKPRGVPRVKPPKDIRAVTLVQSLVRQRAAQSKVSCCGPGGGPERSSG